jgi:hypothetical protein
MLCADILKGWTTFNRSIFVRNQGRQMKVEIHIMFYWDTSWTVALGQIKFGAVKFMNILQILLEPIFSLTKLLNMATVRNVEVMLV